MRLLFLTQYYTPEPNIRAHPLAIELVARGHQVTVVTGFPNYPQGKIYPGYRMRWRQREQLDGVNIIRLPLYPDHTLSPLKRSTNYGSFALAACTLGAALCGPADAMWVHHPPLTVGVPAWWIGLLRRIPFVYEIQDIWPETLVASGVIPEGRLVRLIGRLARLVYRRAAALTVISPGFKRNLASKGVPEQKIHVIPNWSDENIYRSMPRDQALAEQYHLAGHFNVMFSGNMGPAQALEIALEAAARLTDIPDVQFSFIGTGVSVDELKVQVQTTGLTNVQFIPRQPEVEIPRFHAWADALLVQLRNDPLFSITIPSKTMAYMACGRPIICAVPGDGAEVVREAGAGLICPPEDPDALAETVRRLYAMPPEARERMGQAGREAFEQRFTRKVLVDKYETLFESIVDARRRLTERKDTSL